LPRPPPPFQSRLIETPIPLSLRRRASYLLSLRPISCSFFFHPATANVLRPLQIRATLLSVCSLRRLLTPLLSLLSTLLGRLNFTSYTHFSCHPSKHSQSAVFYQFTFIVSQHNVPALVSFLSQATSLPPFPHWLIRSFLNTSLNSPPWNFIALPKPPPNPHAACKVPHFSGGLSDCAPKKDNGFLGLLLFSFVSTELGSLFYLLRNPLHVTFPRIFFSLSVPRKPHIRDPYGSSFARPHLCSSFLSRRSSDLS